MDFFDFIRSLFSDTYTDENGYKRFKDSDRLEHRWAAEKKLRRKLKPWEVVHHIDRNKKNNSFRNLWVFRNQYEHDRIHEIDADRYGDDASYRGRKKKLDFEQVVGIILLVIFLLYLSSK